MHYLDIILLKGGFMKSGYYKKNLKGEMEYLSFYPTPLQNLEFKDLEYQTIDLLSKANYELGRLNELATNIIDVDMFLGSYVRKEAIYSSQIEGTQASLEDILDINSEDSVNIDVEEVVNYVKAINYAIKLLDELPISNRYIKQVHYVLMQGVRGEDKNPGEFRKSQNWIGGVGSTLKNAKYIPPAANDMEECMSDLEKYINEESYLDDLIKAALIHYQFETIHPFLDGNGRIGRILITLFLISVKKIKYPVLYLSYYLKRNQWEYYDRLSKVRKEDDYTGWINFFLEGIIEISKEAIECINKMVLLRNINQTKIKPNDMWLLEFLERNQIINAVKTSDKTNINYYKVNRTINEFVNLGILKVLDESKKKRIYIYQDYVDILKE